MNVLELAQQKVKIKKVSSTNGGEYHGPCPACGGTDRFHVWPNQNEGRGGYWCRGCGKSGDNIQFLRDFEGKNFRESCEILNIKIKDRDGHNETETPKPKEKPEFHPVQHQCPADLWQEKAQKFISWAQENLKQNKEVLRWLADRGIDQDTATSARLGWNPGEKGKDIYRPRVSWGLPEEINEKTLKPKKIWIPIGLVIPFICDTVSEAGIQETKQIILRIRIRRPEGNPPYYVIPGSSMAIMIIGRERRAFVVIESELDAIATAAACELTGAVAMGSSHAKPDQETYDILKNSLQILNALDYDAAGAKAMHWWDEQFPDNCDRWPVPRGKDPGEACQMGTDLNMWIKAGLPPVVTIDTVKNIRSKEEKKVSLAADTSQGTKSGIQESKIIAIIETQGLPPLLAELWKLLISNPAVKIINKPETVTIQRNGKYVGGSINDIIFRNREIAEYILNHPDEEITWKNLLIKREE